MAVGDFHRDGKSDQLIVTAFGSASTSPPVNICVVNDNHAPVAEASAPPTVGEGALVQLDSSA